MCIRDSKGTPTRSMSRAVATSIPVMEAPYTADFISAKTVSYTHLFFAGLRCDEHNHFDVVALGNDTIMFLIITEREIGDDKMCIRDSRMHCIFCPEIAEIKQRLYGTEREPGRNAPGLNC